MLSRKKVLKASAPVICLLLGLLCAIPQYGAGADGFFLDRAAAFVGSPIVVGNYIVILINEKDYRKAARPLGMWGELLAPLIIKAAKGKAKALGLDLVLPQFPLAGISGDHDPAVLRALTFAATKTRLVSGYVILSEGDAREPMPLYRRILGEKGYGYFNLSKDTDGMVRSLETALPASLGRPLVSFAARLAGLLPAPGASVTPDWRHPAVFSTMGFQQALNAPAETFRGKTVLVGLDLPFVDRHHTPAAPGGEVGVIVQARFSRALATGDTLYRPGLAPGGRSARHAVPGPFRSARAFVLPPQN